MCAKRGYATCGRCGGVFSLSRVEPDTEYEWLCIYCIDEMRELGIEFDEV